MYRLLRPALFMLDPETAHGMTLAALRAVGGWPAASSLLLRVFDVPDPLLEVEAFGLRFRNPVGLAAGYDKNGVAAAGLASLGLGHIELGTVTLRPQPGNPRPRVFRFPDRGALVNRMGFPNTGVDALPSALPAAMARHPSARIPAPPVRIGVNIGKGKETPLENAADDYCALLRAVHQRRLADYAAINISSPNTPGLRALQSRDWLDGLLQAVVSQRDSLSPRLPLLVKIAPDLTDTELDEIVEALVRARVDGVVAVNTTLGRDGVPAAAQVAGGLSGAPLRDRATAVIGRISEQTSGQLPIVGVGGIDSAAAALEKLRAGAHLLQVYSGLVYTGPGLIRDINRGLLRAGQAQWVAGPRGLQQSHPA